MGNATGLSENFHEDLASLRIVAEIFIDEIEMLSNQANGGGSNSLKASILLQDQKDLQ